MQPLVAFANRHLVFPALLIAAVMLLDACGKVPSNGVAATSNSVSAPVKGDVASTPPPVPPAGTNAPSMEANQSVVVVKDLGFGKKPPVLEEVLRDLERRSQADDGRGRTFAILEAFTQTDVVSGNLNLCLRLSTEKPGIGEIVYRRTGQSLWKNRVTPATHKSGFTGGSLTILFDTGDGKSFTVDGSMNPPSILDAILKEPGVPVAQAWPEGEVRDVAFIYSACGCPIHVKCRRSGDRTLRVEKATQLIFPDDPAAVEVISRLMRW